MNGAVASLSLSEPSTGAPDPIHLDDSRACPHRDECPAKESESADCTCPISVIRVTGAGTPLSERAELAFPTEAYCCCSRPSLFTYARLTHIDSNLVFWNAAMPTNWVDSLQCPDSAMILATDESGATPSRIDYQLVRRRYDDHGAVATNEVFGTGTLRVWATTLTLEPVTTVRAGSRIVNPCGIATNEAGGLTNTNGCVVQGDSAPVVYAHEFGHLCGLKDIYESRPRKTGLVVTGSVEILKSFPSASFFTETNNQQQNHESNVFAIVCRSISRLGPRFRAH